jgi:hypothetical protein
MKHNKFIALLLAALMLCALCACGNGSTLTAVHPDIAQPGADAQAELSLPSDLSIEAAGETAALYELDNDQSIAEKQIAACFDFDLSAAEKTSDSLSDYYTIDGYRADIEKGIGYWSVIKLNPDPVKSGASMTDEKALEIANALFDKGGLWAEKIDNVKIVDQYDLNEDGVYGVSEKSVFYYPQVDGQSVSGRYRININVSLDGTINSVYYLVSPISSSASVNLKSSSEISSDVKSANYSASFSGDLTDAKITDCTLKYYADGVAHNGKTYLFPVYIMTGEGTNAAGEKETFDIIIDAQK